MMTAPTDGIDTPDIAWFIVAATSVVGSTGDEKKSDPVHGTADDVQPAVTSALLPPNAPTL